jgi:hypothetical protein
MIIRRAIAVLGAALAFGVHGIATAEDAIPNLIGTWTGTFTGGVRSGGGNLAPADPQPTFVHEGMNRQYTLKIDEQQGRGVIGTWSSVSGSERIQGVVRLDTKSRHPRCPWEHTAVAQRTHGQAEGVRTHYVIHNKGSGAAT